MGLNDKPCVRCGSTERYKPPKGRTTGACKACSITYCSEHREERKAYKDKRYIAHPLKTYPNNDKPCIKCGRVDRGKPRKGRMVGQCRVCSAVRRNRPRETYPNNDKPCIKCGSTDRGKPNKGYNLGKCLACGNSTSKRYYVARRDEILAKKVEYHVLHRVERAEYYAEYYAAHRAERAEYRAANSEKEKVYKHNRRARLAGAEGTHTADDWIAILNHYGHRCLRCGATENIHKDHIVALANGGSNWPSNLQPLCGSCNSRKRDFHSTDYRPNTDYECWRQMGIKV